MLKLNHVKRSKSDRNVYCGPAVISAVTGMNTGEAARLIRTTSGVAAVRGTYPYQISRAFEECNIDMVQIENYGHLKAVEQPTLNQWLTKTHGTRGGKVFLVIAGNHWQLVSGNRFVCGITKDVVGFDHKHVKLRSRVYAVYTLKQTGSVKIPKAARKPKAYNPNPQNVLNAKKAALAAEGITMKYDRTFKEWRLSWDNGSRCTFLNSEEISERSAQDLIDHVNERRN